MTRVVWKEGQEGMKALVARLAQEWHRANLESLLVGERSCGLVQGPVPEAPGAITLPTGSGEVVVARDLPTAYRLLEALRHGDREEIRRVQGFPECCALPENGGPWGQALKTVGRCPEGAEGGVLKVRGFPEANTLLLEMGIRALPYRPCSFGCEASRGFAQQLLRRMGSAQELLEMLSAPMEWDAYRGLAIVHTPWFEAVVRGDGPYRRVVRWLGPG